MKLRESNFELLRLISMLFIVWYHLLLMFIVKIDDNPIYKAAYLPLHIAVICFVLLSGYFHIKPSVRGVARLFFPLLFYYVPLTIFEMNVSNVWGIERLLFFSKSPYWFIRTYFCLYLISPVLNSYLNSNSRRLYLLTALGFVSVYLGWYMQDSYMIDGKNLVLFMFIYVLGDCINKFKDMIDKITTSFITVFYVTLNLFLVIGFYTFHDSIIGDNLWRWSFSYSSPVLIMNSVLFFLIFSRMHFSSRIINWLAASVFAVYILHHQYYILFGLIGPRVFNLYNRIDSPLFLILSLGLFSMGIMLAFILMDKLFLPVQKMFLNFCIST